MAASKKKAVKKKTVTKKKVDDGKRKKQLTAEDKRKLFPLEYIKHDFNATKAAVAVGFSQKTAKQAGTRMLSIASVQEQIAIYLQERIERTKIDVDGILLRITAMIDADPLDIFCSATGTFKPLKEWPLIWRQMLSGVDVKELFSGKGNNAIKIGELVKYRFIDKLKALELAGKHVDVQAFAEKRILQGDPNNPIEHRFTVEVIDPTNYKKPKVIEHA